jgi:hypothetical protein
MSCLWCCSYFWLEIVCPKSTCLQIEHLILSTTLYRLTDWLIYFSFTTMFGLDRRWSSRSPDRKLSNRIEPEVRTTSKARHTTFSNQFFIFQRFSTQSPHLTIFKLYCAGQFYCLCWWRKQSTRRKPLINLSTCAGIELRSLCL